MESAEKGASSTMTYPTLAGSLLDPEKMTMYNMVLEALKMRDSANGRQ